MAVARLWSAAVRSPRAKWSSSSERKLTPFELGRYLDYSREMLSMISKTAAIYVQEFPDAVALDAVDEITSLTNGLTRNIWQKIMLLDRLQSTLETSSTRAAMPPLVTATNAAVAPATDPAPPSPQSK